MNKTFSPNMLKTFDLCPKKYQFRYVKNITMPVNDDIFELGKNVHALASYYLRSENIDKMEQALNEKEQLFWNRLKQSPYFSFETIKTEYNLSIKLRDMFFGGRLDALVKDQNDKYYILDYKTGSAPKNAKYDFQTMIYLLAVRAFFKTDNIVFIYLDLANNSEVKIELNSDLITEYEEKLLNITNKIKEEDYSFSNNCDKCEYKVLCYH